ncbi:hypothetical protein [Loktanella sp. Alg231-35]|uniref:hypothetical protein n=1 Tax=Loktanella sp. Alg231-35 TaxID=1922220 RepID=UPI000D553CBA|nr:hypothetical protein [Loktanella sp. Alg231-35]
MSKLLPLLGTLLLAACAGGLGYLAITGAPKQMPLSRQNTTENPSNPLPSQSANLALPTAQPDTVYAAITHRPLFAPTRRPTELLVAQTSVAREPIAKAQTQSWPDDIVLSGVLGTGDDPVALIVANNDEGEWFRVDDSFEGWRVTEIGADWIVFTAGDEHVRLELFE